MQLQYLLYARKFKNTFVWRISNWVYGLCIGINGIIPWYSLLWLFEGFNERWVEVAQSKRRRRESQGNSKNIANGMPHCLSMVVARMTHGEQHRGELREAPGRKAEGLYLRWFVPCSWTYSVTLVKHLHLVYTTCLFLLDVRTQSDERIYRVCPLCAWTWTWEYTESVLRVPEPGYGNILSLSSVRLNLDMASALLLCFPRCHRWYVPGNRV